MGAKKVKRTFIVLVLSFMMFNLFVSMASNSYFLGKILKNNYFLTVELQNNLKLPQIEEFEKFLLKNNSVKGLRYLDKTEAFRNLQKELEIIIPKSENPLPNSIIVSFNNENDIHVVQELLDVNPNVREIYIDSKFLQSTQMKVSAVNTSLFLFLFFAGSMFFLISTTLRGNIFKDYTMYAIKNSQNPKNYTVARNKNLIPFIVSAVIGNLLFFNIYIILRDKLLILLPNLILQSFKQLFFIEFIAVLIVIVVSWKATAKVKKEEV